MERQEEWCILGWVHKWVWLEKYWWKWISLSPAYALTPLPRRPEGTGPSEPGEGAGFRHGSRRSLIKYLNQKGSAAAKRRRTFSVMRETSLVASLWERAEVQAMEPTEKTAPPLGPS